MLSQSRCFEAARDIHRVTPDIVGHFSCADHARDHGTDMQSDTDREAVTVGVAVRVAVAATLIVGVVVGAIGWMLIGKAMMALRQADLTPRETVETLKEDATWMKQQIK